MSQTVENSNLESEIASITEDKKFLTAVEVVVKAGAASTSLLQRKLMIGYAKAACFIDAMEELGLISALNEEKKRITLPKAAEYLSENKK